jgi:hypothetical protein
MEDLFIFFLNLSTAPDLPTREEEHLNHELIGRKFLGSKGLPLFLYIGLILPISQISGRKPVSKIKLNIFSNFKK